MKRSGPPKRVVPLTRGRPLRRSSTLLSSSVKNGADKIAPRIKVPNVKGRRNTGPTPKVRRLVHRRSGDRCEWPGCTEPRCDVQHRLGRKAGGRHGEMRLRINQPAWLVDMCRPHHERVTSAVGEIRAEARAMGWILEEGEDARLVPILTRHSPAPILLDDAGGWSAGQP